MPQTIEREDSIMSKERQTTKKFQILGAFAAVLAFSALTVASASATLWLIGGKSLMVRTLVDAHGELTLSHTGGLAGTLRILCSFLLHGFVGPTTKDEVTDVLGLKGELNKLTCLVHTGNLLCSAGTLILMTAAHLPWLTELKLVGTETVDEMKGTGGETGFSTECNGTSIECSKNETFKFDENLANGALFLAKGLAATCTDGGTGTLSGMVEVLGATVS
jgi:hypothetical protein